VAVEVVAVFWAEVVVEPVVEVVPELAVVPEVDVVD
jgi:hypothetical protein